MFNPFSIFKRSKKVDNFAGMSRDHLDNAEFVNMVYSSTFNGEKFPGSFGESIDYKNIDYYELRRKSSQLILENPYALGALRRILSNEINTGLSLEANIRGEYLGITEDEAQDLSEQIELDWRMYTNNPVICDNRGERNLHQIMYAARREALVEGDCLVTMRIHPQTKLPVLDIIPGRFIKNPFNHINELQKTKIKHGVELDASGKQIAYHIEQEDGGTKRIPAYGAKTGRRIAWLIYASDRRTGETRGLPFLSNMFYMLKELDRYRDSEQRAAFVNSIIAGFIKRSEPTKLTSHITRGAASTGNTKQLNQDGTTNTTPYSGVIPGMYFDRLAQGEEPVSYDAKRPNVNFGAFEASILRVFFWTLGIPPEIGMLEFKNNFSASRQADNEFNVYLKESVKKRGAEFYQIIYETFLYQSALLGKYNAQSLAESWNRLGKWDIYGSWVNSEWTGLSRPSVDIMKDVTAMLKALESPIPLVTADFATRRICNMSYNSVVNQRKKEIKTLERAGLQPQIKQPETVEQSNNLKLIKIESALDMLSNQFEEYSEAGAVE